MDKQEFIKKLAKAKKIVIKIGSAVIVEKGSINLSLLKGIVDDTAFLIQKLSKQVVIVSSGAVASGMSIMNVKNKPSNIVHQQALAAIGQPELINVYRKLFGNHGITVSQVLITADDIQSRRRFINAKNSLAALLKWKSLPIVNENDTVVVKELRFGDNDNLSFHIANLIEADILIMLTDVDGVYDRQPNQKNAKIVDIIDKNFDSSYLNGIGEMGSGGIKSKVESGLKVSQLGKLAVILNGRKDNAIKNLFENKEYTKTIFEPYDVPITSKQSWISSCTPGGVIVIDKGATDSLKNNKSLLASGIKRIYGVFDRGDIVNIESEEGILIAKGVANYDSSEIEKIKGAHSSRIVEILGYKYSNDIVHIDNMIVV